METTDDWTLIEMKLFSHWAYRPFDGETVDNIALFMSLHYFGVISISFHSMCYRLKLEDHSVPLFTSNEIRFDDNFSCQWEFTVWVKRCFSPIERKRRFITTGLPSVFLLGLRFYLTLETGNKCIFSLKITELILWFFDQSEFEKMGRKWNWIRRVFGHWKRRMSEHWLEWNYFLTEQIVFSMEKRATILHYYSPLIILVQFPFLFIAFIVFSR